MPTHKELPDTYLRGKRRRGPAGWSTATLVALIVCVGLAAGVCGALLLHHDPNADASRGAPQTAHRPRQRQRRDSRKVKKVRREFVSAPTRVSSGPAGGLPLAIGSSFPGHGRPAELIVTTYSNDALARSRSPMPLVISYASRYGRPLQPWTALKRGAAASRPLVTGKRYGFCFSQAAGDGYTATRGCGTLVVHQRFNGVQLPDGPVLAERFLFEAR
jgi:hypothetical protein